MARRKTDTPTPQPSTQVSAIAVLTAIKPTFAKVESYGSGKPGSIDLTFRVELPAPPRKPYWMNNPGYDWQDDEFDEEEPPAPPTEADEGESEEDFTARVEEAKDAVKWWKREKAQHAKVKEVREEEAAKFETETRAWRVASIDFAKLSGVMMVFGNQKVRLDIHPTDTDVLPGFELALPEASALTEAAQAAAEVVTE